MLNSTTSPSPSEAGAMLDAASRASQSGVQRALPSRGYFVLVATWAGLLTATVGMAMWLPLFAAGLIGHGVYRAKRGAWMQEVASAGEFYLVILPLGLLFGAIIVASYYCTTRLGLWQVPYVSGIAIALATYTLLEISLRRARSYVEREETDE